MAGRLSETFNVGQSTVVREILSYEIVFYTTQTGIKVKTCTICGTFKQ